MTLPSPQSDPETLSPPPPSPPSGADPQAEYSRRLAAYRAEAAEGARRDRTLANWRGAAFLAGLVLGVLAIRQGLFAGDRAALALALAPVVLFLVLVVLHDRAIRK